MQKQEYNTVPEIQSEWPSGNNITVVNGVGHAEATLINGGNSINHIDASRPVCLSCEKLMDENGVTTDTPFSGKESKKTEMEDVNHKCYQITM